MTSRSPCTIAVLGASGLVGSAVAAALAPHPVRLRLVARRPSHVPAAARAVVDVRVADVTAPGELAAAVAGVDAVVHLVAHLPDGRSWRLAATDADGPRVNAGLARDLVAALRADRRGEPPPVVVFAGSVAQAGRVDGLIDGTESDAPDSPYARQKLAAEQALKSATAEGAVRAVSLRLPTVFGYGPRATVRDRGVVATMVRRALAGEPLPLWHDGSVRRDLLFARDAAQAFVSALGHADRLAGRHWIVGTGQGHPLGEVFATIAGLVAERTGRRPVPVVAVRPPEGVLDVDRRSVTADSSAFRASTGWLPRTSLVEGLRMTVDAIAEEREAGQG